MRKETKVTLSEIAAKRTRLQAVVLGMTMPGLGQISNGELLKGFCCFAVFQMIALLGFGTAVLLPDRFLIPGTAVVLALILGFYLWTIFDAGRKDKAEHVPARYNRWYFYLAVWLVCMAGINSLTYRHIRTGTMQAFKIAGSSMQPTVLQGDFVLVDKTAFEREAPHVNDVVVLINPDNRSTVLIRRIAALPGRPVPGAAGAKETVPHGMVYVSGSRPGGYDSSRFGFIPLRDLLGKARRIYWSSGPAGVRWERIGMKVSSAE